ncbi:ABC-type multidrug transport system fused ATPase/permease subunit [Kineococcus radiotolerans]|uniref:ABC-type multidrug transport system fused ATPase/permease subunit n=1 Tax=Kineococcus radiotolerans TaxID=131568 RepID=A0A7W4XXU5_KINRA|nr:ATP-binding cassette domain-containing protein [Kineococcus radiotolerans]MBB2901862.1 ABC-type multidrug transport system fused ATPase/permease subunit [Kineococcus radiotolerans]
MPHRPAGRPGLTPRRLAGPLTSTAVALGVAAATAETLGAVVTGRIAGNPTAGLLAVLAALVVGASALDTLGRVALAAAVGRAEGALRADLLAAAFAQPVPALAEQAVGEVIDRVDDDPRQLARLLREAVWNLGRGLVRSLVGWVVAGLVWWPAWIAFPVVAVVVWLSVRRLTPLLVQRKVAEEVAWTDHAAQLEEAVAGRDDVRSSLGQPHVVRRYAQLAAGVLTRVRATSDLAATVARRTTLVLALVCSALVVGGTALVADGRLGVAQLVTVWLLSAGFAGDLTQISERLPEVQAGFGAVQRIRALLQAPSEPVGGAPVPPGPLGVAFRGVRFAHPGGFALRDVELEVPAGTTCALVGRSGSGKSTLAALLSRALEPPPGAVLLGGADVTGLDLHQLRRAVGVVTQRTELLAGTLRRNITLDADVAPERVDAAVDSLGLRDWVAGLPAGLETRLGPGGATLSAGEEQLVAFARLLVRDVRVVVLDEATARMDPVTEHRVTAAAQRLLAGRTGLLIAHRLSTTARADGVAVLEDGRVVQRGPREELARTPGPFADLLRAGGHEELAEEHHDGSVLLPRPRRHPRGEPSAARPRLARAVWAAITRYKRWGVLGAVLFAAVSVIGLYGAVEGWLWGLVVEGLQRGGGWEEVRVPAAALVLTLLAVPFALSGALRVYPLWWNAVTLSTRLAVLRGQTRQRRLTRVPAGEVAARCLDSERFVLYVDRCVDVVIGLFVATVTAAVARDLTAGAVVAAVMVGSAAVSVAGTGVSGRRGRAAGDARAAFGRELGSAVDAARTVKLAAAVPDVLASLARVDAARVRASVGEFRVRALLEGVPGVLVQCGVVATWLLHLLGRWSLADALLVSTAVAGASYYGTVAGAVITEAPVAREWLRAVTALSGTGDVVRLPPGIDLVRGTAPPPATPPKQPLRRLSAHGFSAVHDDGTVGVQDVDLQVEAGELVLLTGRVGSGKSSLLAALAGLVDHEGSLRWNGSEVEDPQTFLRPGQVGYVAQVPRVLSGSFTDNVTLDHPHARALAARAVRDARLARDVTAAGGDGALVGHRGVRLSGGQVQRLALARALATGADLLVADDVSSALDARTELELWEALRDRGTTVIGSSSKRSALRAADRVVVLVEGRVAASGPWAELEGEWGFLAG